MARTLGLLLLSAVLSTLSATWPPASSVASAAELDKKGKSDAKEAMRFYKEGNYEDAAKLFLRLSLTYPDMLVFVRNLGACYYYMRRYEPALSNLRDYLHRKTDIAPDDRAEVAGWIGEMERIRDQATAVAPPATAPPAATPPAAAPPAAAAAPVPVPPVPVPTPGTPAAPTTPADSSGGAGAAPLPAPAGPTPPVAAPDAPTAAPTPPAPPPPAPGPEPAFPPQYPPQPSFPSQGAYPSPPTYPQPGPYPAQPEYPAPGAYPPAPQPYPPMTSAPGYAPQPGYAPAAGPPLGVATQAPPPPPPQGSSTGRKVAAWMLAIVGLGTAGAGGYFTYRAHSKANDLEKKYSPSLDDERKKAVIYSGVCYGVGGALVLTGIIVGATGGSSGGVALAPTVGPGTAGATLSGSF